MNNKISRNEFNLLIQKLADNIEIEELAVRLGLQVKKIGDKSVSLCIEHSEKNPSMQLYKNTASDRSHYHCFSCSAHGDIFKLVQIVRGVTFVAAVQWLAEMYGYPISKQIIRRASKNIDPITPKVSKKDISIDSKPLEAALEIYKTNSKEELPNWLNRRKIKPSTCKKAEITLATPKTLWREIEKYKADYGVFRELLEKFESAGLIRREISDVSNNWNPELNLGISYRDFFYDERVIFPIRDEQNKLLGFAGRKTKDSKYPKYLYTPGLPKASILYRSHEAFQKTTEAVKNITQPILYICEGLLDCLRLEELGHAAVAVLGSNLSDHQSKIIIDYANSLPEKYSLKVKIFFDRDNAGLKGAANSIEKLLINDILLRIEPSFIWVLNDDLSSANPEAKDPDDFLKSYDTFEQSESFLNRATHPSALALVAEKLKITPASLVDNEAWSQIPQGAKIRTGQYLWSISQSFPQRLLSVNESTPLEDKLWVQELLQYSEQKLLKKEKIEIYTSPDRYTSLKLNLARELAQAGANKGEVLSDIASWRRLSLAATTFNEGISSRLKQNQFQPIEPFDAVHVSRGFGKDEARLKSMPCPEDLIAQQYILNELLSEQLDDGTEFQFSNCIPAVRYYRDSNQKRTTGEKDNSSLEETLSFAYQIDMDVIEGRQPPTSGGMFRPYFDCWKEFIESLLSQGKGMSQVHMIRLDLKRYYDNIKRSVMKNMLQNCLDSAHANLANSESFAPVFQPQNFTGERNRATVDFLVDQSFGFSYYDPDTGDSKKSDRERGIPQGPVLSAWLGNSLLFKLDSTIREKLKEYNSEHQQRAGYARYVDDVVVISDSLDILNVLRAIVEDITSSLGLEMVPKESFAPMNAEEFLDELTSGRALAVSGPLEETEIFDIEDIEDGWDSWQDREITRQNSLELLRDTRLYHAPSDIIISQVYTALKATDLRPSELTKAARWAWYVSAITWKEHGTRNFIEVYWDTWNTICKGFPLQLNSELAWDDPAFYALEGLQNLLERANQINYGYNSNDSQLRQQGISELAKASSNSDFFRPFYSKTTSNHPEGWANGTHKLKRMFIQRVICIQWMASQLSSSSTSELGSFAIDFIDKQSITFQISLTRAMITDAETNRRDVTGLTVSGDPQEEWNLLKNGFLWLHKAIVAFSVRSEPDGADPLTGFAQELILIKQKAHNLSSPFTLINDKFLSILNCLLPSNDNSGVSTEEAPGEIILLALQTFAAITPRESLAHHLVSRHHLLQNGESKIPFPPLPGIPAKGLLLYSDKETDSSWVKITKVWWVTLPSNDTEIEEAPCPVFQISTADAPAQEFRPEWSSISQIGKLEVFEANLSKIQNFWTPIAPPSFDISASKLRWISDAYEAIARINILSSKQNEYVPAWPYLVTNNRPDYDDKSTVVISLFTPTYPTSSLDGLAFVRDGSRGLRTIEIPEQYGMYWRTGVFLSEIAGFRRDIDTFAELNAHLLEDGKQEILEPANHLLKNILRKLRGTYFKDQVLSSLENEEHLPATVARSLDLLRNFPLDGKLSDEISYVISSEIETAAMGIRLSGQFFPFAQGVFCHYIEKIAIKVLRSIPASWIPELTSNNTHHQLLTNRAIPSSYFHLYNIFSNSLGMHYSAPLQVSTLSTLIAGCKLAAVTTWAREIAFTLQALGEDIWPYPVEGELAQSWNISEKGFLVDSPEDSVTSLNDFFSNKVKTNSSTAAFSNITPLGWLTLIAGRVGLFGYHRNLPLCQEWNTETKEMIGKLAVLLSETPAYADRDSKELDRNWPLEFNCEQLISSWNESWVTKAINCLAEIESNLNIRVENSIASWKLNSSDNTFKTLNGEEWLIQKWQIVLSGGVKPERVQQNSKMLSAWQETFDIDNNLLLISARDERLSSLLISTNKIVSNEVLQNRSYISNTAEGPALVIEADVSPEKIIEAQNTSQEHPEVLTAGNQPYKTSNPTLTSTKISSYKKPLSDWRSLQERAWDNRKERSPGHVRIAIMQWKVEDTYRHPVVDANDWNNEIPPNETNSLSPSNNERRRQKYLLEALNTCKSFGVDLLVLPEYSVRPDTIKWLKDQLRRKSGMPAVLAGTYKLFGNITDQDFTKIHHDILGLSDHLKTFATLPPEKPKTAISGEYSSTLTLLAPLKLSNGERFICTFSRRKKYSSLAASEVFSPSLEPLTPLFSAEHLLSEIKRRAPDGSRTQKDQIIKPEEILDYIKQLKHLQFSTEFICSELFLPMSPVNYKALAAELHKLAIKFGHTLSRENADKILIEDLKSMSEYLGLSGDGVSRRSIIIVPAMTSRSADYWIFGQAALLSGGATTVFCNAVCKKNNSVGGSCFIGRESWNNNTDSVFHDLVTPYAGWSKGIYYNKPKDALGQTEQALIIADIDPSFMQEGKPRPQALAVPLQLVAHLPIAELTDEKRNQFYLDMDVATAIINSEEMFGRTVAPGTPGINLMHQILYNIFDKDNIKPLDERYDHWQNHWRSNPKTGVPSVTTDWLVVDIDENFDVAPSIFTPPFPAAK